MIRLLIAYTGNVQGVGFRWNVSNIAKSFTVTGYVMNLLSGKVELLVEGEKNEVFKMISELELKLNGFWQFKQVEQKEGQSHYNVFKIRYY